MSDFTTRVLPWANLALIAVGFGTMVYLFDARVREELAVLPWEEFSPLAVSLTLTIVAVWIGLWFNDFPQRHSDSILTTLQPISTSLGLAFLVQALLGYVRFPSMLSLTVMIAGAICTAVLLAATGWVVYPKFLPPDAPVLYLGFDRIAAAVHQAYNRSALGALEIARSRVPDGIEFLGSPAELESVVDAKRPGEIVVDMDNWASVVSPSSLLNMRLGGVAIVESEMLYENLFRRVCTERLRPSNLALSTRLDPPRRHLAFQAIYSNLIGLGLLILAMPLMIVAAVLVKLFSGPGPVLERVECAGFKEIPFQRLRFRAYRTHGARRMTTIAKILAGLRLLKLPELINVVRGEMALVGPEPERYEHVIRLTKLIPFYPQRFLVKPGLTGWARLHRRRREIVHVFRELEYDLYYVQHVSPIFDLEILLTAALRIN